MVELSEERKLQYVDMLKGCATGDIECDHGHADGILCKLLEELGYHDIVEVYSTVDKWYA